MFLPECVRKIPQRWFFYVNNRGNHAGGVPKQNRRSVRLRLEVLEDRVTPAIFNLVSLSATASWNEGGSGSNSISFPDTVVEAGNGPVGASIELFPDVNGTKGIGVVDLNATAFGRSSAKAEMNVGLKILPSSGESSGEPITFSVENPVSSQQNGATVSEVVNGIQAVGHSHALSGFIVHIGDTVNVDWNVDAPESPPGSRSNAEDQLYFSVGNDGYFVPDAGGPYVIADGQSLNLDASKTSNPYNLPLAYSWNIDVNGTWVNGVATGQTATLNQMQLETLGIKAANSPYQVCVAVTDTEDNTTIISQPTQLTVVPATVTPTSVTWDKSQGGVDLGYQVSDSPVLQDTKVALYWSSSEQFADAIGDPVYSMDIPAGKTPGTYGPFNVSASQLGTPPTDAKYLLVVTDPKNELGNFDPNQNVAAISYDPEVTVTAKYDGQPSDGEMGRYFQNMPGTALLADNYYTVDLSPSLAALRPDVEVNIGSQILTANPAADDPTTYTTNAFDPGSLPAGETPLLGEALIDGQDVEDDSSTVLVEPLPSWFSSLQGAKLSFDPNAAGADGEGAYVFSGNLPDFLLGGTFFTIPTSVPLIGGQPVSGGVGFGVKVVASLDAQSPPPLEVGLNAQVRLGQTTLLSTNIPAQLSGTFANGKVTLSISTGVALDPLTLEEPGGFSATIGLDYKYTLPSINLANASELVFPFGIPVELQGSVDLGGSLELKANAQIVSTAGGGLELDPTGTDVGIAMNPTLTGTLRAGWFAPSSVVTLLKIRYPSVFSGGTVPGLYLQDAASLTGTIEADQHFGGSFSSLMISDLVFSGSLTLSDKLQLLAEIGNTQVLNLTLLNVTKPLYQWSYLD